MKKLFFCLALGVGGCGSNLSVGDGQGGTSTQGASADGATVSLDLTAIYEGVCKDAPADAARAKTEFCASHCAKVKDAPEWCGKYDTYCAERSNADSSFCLWWVAQ